MAENNTAPESTKPVDLDEIEVEILIIARNASVLNQSAQFLTRRGWPTSVQDNISKAIEYIAEKKPDFVFLSLNHPSPGMAKLPDLIVQTFNLTCIGFVEIQDGVSAQKLNQSKIRYKVQGAPSGPNLQRFVRRMLAERFGMNEEAKPDSESKTAARGEGPNAITVKGASGDGPTLIQKAAGAGGEWNTVISGSETDGFSATAAPKKKMSLKALSGEISPMASGNMLAGESVEGTASAVPEHVSSSELAKMLKKSVLADGDSGATDMTKEEAEAEAAAVARSSRDSYDESLSPAKPFGMTAGVPTYNGADSKDGPTYEGGNAKEGPTYDSAVVVPFRKKPEGEGHATLLARAVETAIRKICVFPKEEHYQDLNNVHEVGVFPIDSAVVSGYLVIGWKGDEDMRREFLQQAETSIRGSFADMQVAANIESGFMLTIPSIHFREWMAEKSTFGFSTPHKTAELGVAFIALGRPLPKARASEAADMYCIEIVDMSTTQPVNFQAYLNLEANQKYVLYLRAGRILQPEQKKRLLSAKIKDFFTKSVDLQNVRKFFAATYVVDSIREFLKKAS